MAIKPVWSFTPTTGWVTKNKGAVPYPFTPQPNKWGYQNNPRWTSQASAPVSYDGRESEEPQIWESEFGVQSPYPSNSSKDHIPCGHWHRAITIHGEATFITGSSISIDLSMFGDFATRECIGLPVINYISQQMAINGTQNLYATGGGGGPYTWAIIVGGGNLSETTTIYGEDNLYTAPSSNTNCVNNPTIQVTDYCGKTATLKIAVNAYDTPVEAYVYIWDQYPVLGCTHHIWKQSYDCDGNNYLNQVSCDGCDCSGPYECPDCCCVTPCEVPCGYFACTQENVIARCSGCDDCMLGNTEKRTELMKTEGCCPVIFL